MPCRRFGRSRTHAEGETQFRTPIGIQSPHFSPKLEPVSESESESKAYISLKAGLSAFKCKIIQFFVLRYVCIYANILKVFYYYNFIIFFVNPHDQSLIQLIALAFQHELKCPDIGHCCILYAFYLISMDTHFKQFLLITNWIVDSRGMATDGIYSITHHLTK